MSDNSYVVDEIVTGTETVTKIDRDGIDRIEISGSYDVPTSINLGWAASDGISSAAEGLYFFPDTIGHRLIVSGLIEDARGGSGADFIQGNEQPNFLEGELLSLPLGGNDTLWGGDGNDTIEGGGGNDEILGDDDADTLFGEDGADTIAGGGGDDTVFGGPGADEMAGGGDARDTLSYGGSERGVRIRITYGETTVGAGGDAEGDRIAGFRFVIGSAGNDRITDTVQNAIAFGYNANSFGGGRGNDTLDLGGGDDSGVGGAGRDTLAGGRGDDALLGEGEADLLLGEENDDTLDGGAGADRLRGGEGDDSLIGGTGADAFVFETALPGPGALNELDRIADFARAAGDRIVLTAIDANAGRAGNQGFDLIAGESFGGRAGELIRVATSGGVSVRGDMDGDGFADFSIFVEGISRLRVGDFDL